VEFDLVGCLHGVRPLLWRDFRGAPVEQRLLLSVHRFGRSGRRRRCKSFPGFLLVNYFDPINI